MKTWGIKITIWLFLILIVFGSGIPKVQAVLGIENIFYDTEEKSYQDIFYQVNSGMGDICALAPAAVDVDLGNACKEVARIRDSGWANVGETYVQYFTAATRVTDAAIALLGGVTTPYAQNYLAWLQRLKERINRGSASTQLAVKEAQTPACNIVAGTFSLGSCINEGIAFLGDILVKIADSVLKLVNLVFDKTLAMSIINFKTYADMPGVLLGWRVIRDLINILFIAALFYVAIGTILQLGNVDWKKMVVNIIIAALLINFSLVFARAIIDFSNLLAVTFYYNSAPGSPPSISSALIRGLNLKQGMVNTGSLDTLSIVTGYFGSFIMILVTAFVLAVAIFLFVTRMVVLLFLLVLAPIGFVGLILPAAKKYADEWWDQLIKQAMLAPAYTGIMFVVIKMVTASDGLQSKVGAAGTPGIVIYFIIIIGLMLGALIIAKQIGALGSGAILARAEKFKSGAVGLARGAAAGAVGGVAKFAASRTIGKAAKYLAERPALKEQRLVGTGKIMGVPVVPAGFRRAIGRGLKGGLEKVSAVTGYEARLEREAKEAEQFKKPEETAGYMAGATPRSREEIYKKLSANQKLELEQFLAKTTRPDLQSLRGEMAGFRQKLPPSELADLVRRATPDNQARYLTELKTDGTQAISNEKQKEIYEKMSPRERVALEEEMGRLGKIAVRTPQEEQTFRALTTAITRLNTGLTAEDREKTDSARAERIKTKGSLDQAGQIHSLSTPEAQRTAYEKLAGRERVAIESALNGAIAAAQAAGDTARVAALTGQQTTIQTLRTGLSAEEKSKTDKAEREAKKETGSEKAVAKAKGIIGDKAGAIAPTATPDQIRDAIRDLTDEQIKEIDISVLIQPQIAEHLSAGKLQVLQKEGLTDAQKQDIRNAIEGAVIRSGATPTPQQIQANDWLNGPGGKVF